MRADGLHVVSVSVVSGETKGDLPSLACQTAAQPYKWRAALSHSCVIGVKVLMYLVLNELRNHIF